ncbi:YgjP-like metallopeptidase domain-containing protein [Ferriphaselus sp. R-1]|uniref:YgjP-like metallopeptidase domain-containing protein n=1 Tax=Ferriphaselus sp. R-1 TaxID=1485544 RepID=UPI00054F6960|nr:YgjP-like metallopeptidase domain-containing protein [Ferriphaselus sp. R-1]
MRPHATPNYLTGYPAALIEQVHQLIAQEKLAPWLLAKYPQAHAIRTDSSLYDYVHELKNQHLRNAGQLSRVAYDPKLHIIKNALGTHTNISRVQGGKLKAKQEIRIATLFRQMPQEFLHMIVVHELAHIKQRNHDKAFYQLCQHMEPAYSQLEFELRAYLTYLDRAGAALWVTPPA